MITMLNLGCNGRLGNQLFQYAALRSAGLSNNIEVKIPNQSSMYWHGQNSLLNRFNIEAKIITKEDINALKYQINEPPNTKPGTYLKILENIPSNTNINGFFQNEKYFVKNKNLIVKELQVKNSSESLSNLNKYSDSYKVISLHIRMGDNIDGTNPYRVYYGSGPLDSLSMVGKYNLKAIEMLQDKDTLFMIFGGGSRSGDDTNDIKFLINYFDNHKEKFYNPPIVNQSNDPINDFIIMQNCYSNITSYASSFSWWASYLNLEANKIIAPKHFYYNEEEIPEDGFFPTNWTLI